MRAKTLIRLGGCPGWSESLLGAHSLCWFCHEAAHMRHITRKSVFVVCDQLRHKPACSADETSQSLETSAIASRGIILSTQLTTKALIRLHRCAGWSAPLLFAYGIRQVFSWYGPYTSKRLYMGIHQHTVTGTVWNWKLKIAYCWLCWWKHCRGRTDQKVDYTCLLR